MNEAVRLPHAVLDLTSRRLKAIKIERILGLSPETGPIDLLEVGTGSGGIARYFGSEAGLDCRVTSVDVVDCRTVQDGYRFVRVDGIRLPFENSAFDVVISNHVIEHVGDGDAQLGHLSELRRVLRPGGRGYLAVPNRWMVVEPHYRLAFLSWWPRSWRSPYLRLMRGYEFYDCEPLEMGVLEHMLSATGWTFRNSCIAAATIMREIEPGSRGLAVYDAMAESIKTALLPVMPTLIYRLDKPDECLS